MTDPTAEFFEGLRRRDYEPALGRRKGTVRIDVVDGNRTDKWFVAFDDGKLSVSKRNQAVDSSLRADKAIFDRMVQGEVNAVAALLRGAISIEGDLNVMIIFQRLLP